MTKQKDILSGLTILLSLPFAALEGAAFYFNKRELVSQNEENRNI